VGEGAEQLRRGRSDGAVHVIGHEAVRDQPEAEAVAIVRDPLEMGFAVSIVAEDRAALVAADGDTGRLGTRVAVVVASPLLRTTNHAGPPVRDCREPAGSDGTLAAKSANQD